MLKKMILAMAWAMAIITLLSWLGVAPASAQISGTISPDYSYGGDYSPFAGTVIVKDAKGNIVAELSRCSAEADFAPQDCVSSYGTFTATKTKSGDFFAEGEYNITGIDHGRYIYAFAEVLNGAVWLELTMYPSPVQISTSSFDWIYQPNRSGRQAVGTRVDLLSSNYEVWVKVIVTTRTTAWLGKDSYVDTQTIYKRIKANSPALPLRFSSWLPVGADWTGASPTACSTIEVQDAFGTAIWSRLEVCTPIPQMYYGGKG